MNVKDQAAFNFLPARAVWLSSEELRFINVNQSLGDRSFFFRTSFLLSHENFIFEGLTPCKTFQKLFFKLLLA